MELNEFLERFLPDYDEKFDEAYNNRHSVENPDDEFFDKYFSEALQNFADEICREQRDNCCRAFGHSREKYNDFENEGIGDSTYEIENAEQPKIEDVCIV